MMEKCWGFPCQNQRILNRRPLQTNICALSISTVEEKDVAIQIEEFTEHIPPDKQTGLCTTSALLNIIDAFHRDDTLNSKLVVLDFDRAFDSVNVDLLIAKLKYYRFSQTAQNWFHSYLKDVSQVTKVEEISSTALPKNCGFPQRFGPALVQSLHC